MTIDVFVGLSPFPGCQWQMKVYRDSLLNMKQSWWSLLLERGTTQCIYLLQSIEKMTHFGSPVYMPLEGTQWFKAAKGSKTLDSLSVLDKT